MIYDFVDLDCGTVGSIGIIKLYTKYNIASLI
jgi:hypothetical protein